MDTLERGALLSKQIENSYRTQWEQSECGIVFTAVHIFNQLLLFISSFFQTTFCQTVSGLTSLHEADPQHSGRLHFISCPLVNLTHSPRSFYVLFVESSATHNEKLALTLCCITNFIFFSVHSQKS